MRVVSSHRGCDASCQPCPSSTSCPVRRTMGGLDRVPVQPADDLREPLHQSLLTQHANNFAHLPAAPRRWGAAIARNCSSRESGLGDT